MFKRVLLLTAVLCALAGTAAAAGFWEIYANPTRANALPVSLCCFPDGNGKAFSQAYHSMIGGMTDATLHVQLLADGVDIIVNFPAEDLWLESTGTAMSMCPGGSIADGNTDSEGRTLWADPLQVGGQCNPDAGDVLVIMVSGNVPVDGMITDFYINSPDINGDLAVDLADIGEFSIDYYGAYHYRCDLVWDGFINLADIGLLAAALGGRCP